MHFAGAQDLHGWTHCDGRLLQIEGNNSLLSVLGNRYGGDGKTTFALPDLREKEKDLSHIRFLIATSREFLMPHK